MSSNPKKDLYVNEEEVRWVKQHLNSDVNETEGFQLNTPDHGQVSFHGATRRAKGKFIRLSNKTEIGKVYEFLTNVWGMEVPQLLVSVTGGAKSFQMNPKLKQLFASGLSKVAQTPGAWVITGGTNTGVMKHVGEALQGVTKACLGIATWGIVQNREQLSSDVEKPTGGKFEYSMASSLVQQGAFLDHNHTHFLLVDNGTTGKYGVEIPFRAAIEKYVMEKSQDNKRVPSVLLVIEGGPGTLGTITNAVKGEQAVPVVIIKDSGRAADCIAHALEMMTDEEAQEHSNFESPDERILSFVKDTFPEVVDEKKLASLYNQVVECVLTREAFTVFQMGGGAGVDEAILTALLKSHKTSPVAQLQLTLLWDRADLARDKLLRQGTLWEEADLNDAMIMALALNRVSFVRLLLEFSISIPSLLTNDRLEFLYGFRSRSNMSTLRYEFEASQYTAPKQKENVMELLCKFEGFNLSSCAIQRKTIVRVVNRLCDCFRRQGTEEFIENLDLKNNTSASIEMSNAKQNFQYPYKELFIWAVTNNMQEMATYLWEFEEEGMAKAFLGSAISTSLIERAIANEAGEEVEQALNNNAEMFNELSFLLLDECYKADKKKTVSVLTTECIQFPSQTCLGLAVASKHKRFVSHSAVQSLLNDVWTGAIKQCDIRSTQVIWGLLFPPYILTAFNFRNESELMKMARTYENEVMINESENVNGTSNESLAIEENTSITSESSTEQHKKRLVEQKPRDYQSTASQQQPIDRRQRRRASELPWYKKLYEFYFQTPIVKFFTNLIAYCVFLGLFSYVAILKKHNTTPEFAEWILISFVVSLTVEEIYQFIQSDSQTFIGKFWDWASSKWNLLDALAIILFFVALGLRLNESTRHIGHLFYALDAGLWILRLLDVFYAHRILGPYVVMIYGMFIDMMYFLVILLVFLLAYGVSTKAILTPQGAGWEMLRDSFFHPYYNIYGELFIDRDPENDVTTRFGTPVINSYAEPITWVLLGCYLLIANVLLLNLLIAIFNNTFTEVQENSAQIWKFERYHLIVEYANRPPLVPPLMLLCHIYMLLRWIFKLCSGCCRDDVSLSGQKNDIRSKCHTKTSSGHPIDVRGVEDQCPPAARIYYGQDCGGVICDGPWEKDAFQDVDVKFQSHLNQQERDELIEFEVDCMATYVRNKREPWTDENQIESTKSLLDMVEDLGSMMMSIEDRLKKAETQNNTE